MNWTSSKQFPKQSLPQNTQNLNTKHQQNPPPLYSNQASQNVSVQSPPIQLISQTSSIKSQRPDMLNQQFINQQSDDANPPGFFIPQQIQTNYIPPNSFHQQGFVSSVSSSSQQFIPGNTAPQQQQQQQQPIAQDRLSSRNSSTSRQAKRALFRNTSGSNVSSGGRGRQHHQSSGKSITSQQEFQMSQTSLPRMLVDQQLVQNDDEQQQYNPGEQDSYEGETYQDEEESQKKDHEMHPDLGLIKVSSEEILSNQQRKETEMSFENKDKEEKIYKRAGSVEEIKQNGDKQIASSQQNNNHSNTALQLQSDSDSKREQTQSHEFTDQISLPLEDEVGLTGSQHQILKRYVEGMPSELLCYSQNQLQEQQMVHLSQNQNEQGGIYYIGQDGKLKRNNSKGQKLPPSVSKSQKKGRIIQQYRPYIDKQVKKKLNAQQFSPVNSNQPSMKSLTTSNKRTIANRYYKSDNSSSSDSSLKYNKHPPKPPRNKPFIQNNYFINYFPNSYMQNSDIYSSNQPSHQVPFLQQQYQGQQKLTGNILPRPHSSKRYASRKKQRKAQENAKSNNNQSTNNIENEEIARQITEIKAENEFNSCLTKLLREQIKMSMKKIYKSNDDFQQTIGGSNNRSKQSAERLSNAYIGHSNSKNSDLMERKNQAHLKERKIKQPVNKSLSIPHFDQLSSQDSQKKVQSLILSSSEDVKKESQGQLLQNTGHVQNDENDQVVMMNEIKSDYLSKSKQKNNFTTTNAIQILPPSDKKRLQLSASKMRDQAPLSFDNLEKENKELVKKNKELNKKIQKCKFKLTQIDSENRNKIGISKLKKILASTNSYITYLHNKVSTQKSINENYNSTTSIFSLDRKESLHRHYHRHQNQSIQQQFNYDSNAFNSIQQKQNQEEDVKFSTFKKGKESLASIQTFKESIKTSPKFRKNAQAYPFSERLISLYFKDIETKERLLIRISNAIQRERERLQLKKEEQGERGEEDEKREEEEGKEQKNDEKVDEDPTNVQQQRQQSELDKLINIHSQMEKKIQQLKNRKFKYLQQNGDLHIIGYQVYKMQQGQQMYDKVSNEEQSMKQKYKLVSIENNRIYHQIMTKLGNENLKLKLQVSRHRELIS